LFGLESKAVLCVRGGPGRGALNGGRPAATTPVACRNYFDA